MSSLLSVSDVAVVLRALSDADAISRGRAAVALSVLPLDAAAARAALELLRSAGREPDFPDGGDRQVRARLAAAAATLPASAGAATRPGWPEPAFAPETVAAASQMFEQGVGLLWAPPQTDFAPLAALPDEQAAALITRISTGLIERASETTLDAQQQVLRAGQIFRALRWGGRRPVHADPSGWVRAVGIAVTSGQRPDIRVVIGRILAQAHPARLLALAAPVLGSARPDVRRRTLADLVRAAPALRGIPSDLAPSQTAADEPFAALAALCGWVAFTQHSPDLGIPQQTGPERPQGGEGLHGPRRPAPPPDEPSLPGGLASESPQPAPQRPAPQWPASQPPTQESPYPASPYPASPYPASPHPGPSYQAPSYQAPPYQPVPAQPQIPSATAPPPRESSRRWFRFRRKSRQGTTQPVPTHHQPDPAASAVRSVYARLDAPDEVITEEVFHLFVGLAPSAGAGVITAPFGVPNERFTLDVRVLAEGFRVLGGRLARQLAVSDDDPYPYELIRLAAEDLPGLLQERAIQAVYMIDGQIIGVASRLVRVVPGGAPAPGVPATGSRAMGSPAPGTDWALPTDPAARPDLEVVVAPGNDAAGNRLVWCLRSRHRGVSVPTEPIPVTTGGTNAEWARTMMRGVEDRNGAADRAYYLQGIGYEIQNAMPAEFWAAIRAVAAVTAPHPPSLLLASWDPYIPWELATVDEPWDAGQPAVLGAQTVMGRWTYREQHRTPAPPASLTLATMAVVSAVYAPNQRLPEAEAEADDLAGRYGAARVPAAPEPVLGCLRGLPEADTLHVALHGKLDVTGSRDGLLMVDGAWLSPRSVRGVGRSPVRLVFLNACQVGQGQQALGEPTGMAAALVGIGAGAVVAPLWTVDDRVARTVAEGFYPAVLAGESPAEYLRRRRGASTPCSTSVAADAGAASDGGVAAETVLAYVYFGHPRLRVRWTGRDNGA